MRTRIAVSGLGNVGRRLLELIESKRGLLQQRFNLELVVVGACDTSGAIVDPNGLDIARLIEVKRRKKGVAADGGSKQNPIEFARSADADVFVELTLTNLKDGEPGLSAMRAALGRSMHVVSANKGPLVLAYPELAGLAQSNGVKLLHSATVTGGLPTLNIGARDLGAAFIRKFEGVVNGTTNYILSRMTEGQPYETALKHAQDVGMAEADPSLDVDGWDAANKLVIIANAVLRRPTTLSDLSVEGIRGVTPEQLQSAASDHRVIKLVAAAEWNGSDYRLTVRPTALDTSHPLAGVAAEMMGVMYHTDINGTIFAVIREEDPYPTAAAVLRDIVHIFTH
jgi:homoserine dehydrogenase